MSSCHDADTWRQCKRLYTFPGWLSAFLWLITQEIDMNCNWKNMILKHFPAPAAQGFEAPARSTALSMVAWRLKTNGDHPQPLSYSECSTGTQKTMLTQQNLWLVPWLDFSCLTQSTFPCHSLQQQSTYLLSVFPPGLCPTTSHSNKHLIRWLVLNTITVHVSSECLHLRDPSETALVAEVQYCFRFK